MGQGDDATGEETETCIRCGLTVAVDHPVFLEWHSEVAGLSTCPDCRETGAQESGAHESERRRAA